MQRYKIICKYAKLFVILQAEKSKKKIIGMKKYFLVCLMVVCSMLGMAQQDSVYIQLTPVDLELLHEEYPTPMQYLDQLQRLQLAQETDGVMLRERSRELREARAQLQSLSVCLDETKKTIKKVEKEYRKLLQVQQRLESLYSKQQTHTRRSLKLEVGTRNRMLHFVNGYYRNLRNAVDEVEDHLADLENQRPLVQEAQLELTHMQQDLTARQLELEQAIVRHKMEKAQVREEIKKIEPLARMARKQ